MRALIQEIFDPTPEQRAAREGERRQSDTLLNAAAGFPTYPTKKGLHLIRRALPHVPLRLDKEERAQKGGGK
jgi:hypothetical protein